MLPRFEIVRRKRPIDLVAPSSAQPVSGRSSLPLVAPYAAARVPAREGAELAFHLGGARLRAVLEGDSVRLVVSGGAQPGTFRSRRHGRAQNPSEFGLTLTGPHLTAWCRENGRWVARARRDLRDDPSTGSGHRLDVHDEDALAAAQVETPEGATAGRFGQLGLRDIRLVSFADGRPWGDAGDLWFTATSAGPGFFDSGHTSVWRFSPDSLTLTHRADLFFRRPDLPGVFGDHATHLVRDGDRWLVATSTWGDFEQPATRAQRRTPSTLRVTLAESTDDLLTGAHGLDTQELRLPTDGLSSLAVWDPHLVRRDGEWLVGFVSASRFFRFHPALASGPALGDLRLRGAAADRTATEGTTILELDGELRVVASDGRDGRRGQREAYPVFDLAMTQVGELAAPYPTNIPWPTLARLDDGWAMLTFNGRRYGGKLLGYGTHGDLVVMRSR